MIPIFQRFALFAPPWQQGPVAERGGRGIGPMPVSHHACSSVASERCQGRQLVRIGLAVFVLGMLTGFLGPLAGGSHLFVVRQLEIALSGLLLTTLGLQWCRVCMRQAWRRPVISLLVCMTLGHWLYLVCSAWQAGRATAAPVAAQPWYSFSVSLLLIGVCTVLLCHRSGARNRSR